MTPEDHVAENVRQVIRFAKRQDIKGLDSDDIVGEALLCLWQAARTYNRPTIPFMAYYHSLWANRANEIRRYFRARKRPDETAIDPDVIERALDAVTTVPGVDKHLDSALVYLPRLADLDRGVFGLLALGFTPTDIKEVVGISQRRYYKAIDNFREVLNAEDLK